MCAVGKVKECRTFNKVGGYDCIIKAQSRATDTLPPSTVIHAAWDNTKRETVVCA